MDLTPCSFRVQLKEAAICSLCNKEYSCKNSLRQHLKTHDSNRERRFECLIKNCGRTFYTKAALTGHNQSTHSTLWRFECNLCDAKYKSNEGLSRHVTSIHCQEKAYQCDKCPKRFSNLSNLKGHAYTHTDEKRFSCTECLEKFKRPNGLRSHVKTHHQPRKHYNCNLCDKSYLSNYNLRHHMRSTHEGGGSQFVCYFCKRELSDRSCLECHIHTHTGEKSYICPVTSCRYSCAHPSSLRQHRRIHHAEVGLLQPPRKLWSCYFCPKKYTESHNLRIHTRLHTREKPFPCNLCRRSFVSGNYLTTHIFNHTKEKPYKCTECDKSFTTSSNGLAHISSTHRKVKRHFCDFCEYGSYYKSCISVHRSNRHAGLINCQKVL